MTQSEFRLIFADQVNKCEETLRMKKKEYTGDREDRLSAFRIAASLQDCTPQRALVGMMAKHIVSLYDMCYAKNTSFTKELWDEKITDSLNYLFCWQRSSKRRVLMNRIETKILNCSPLAKLKRRWYLQPG